VEATPATATGPICGAAPGPEARFCAEIVLSPAGGTLQALAQDGFGSRLLGRVATWGTSDPNVATVSHFRAAVLTAGGRRAHGTVDVMPRRASRS